MNQHPEIPAADAPPRAGDHASLIAATAQLLRSSRDWTQHIDRIFALIGQGLGISRVYLFQIHEVEGEGLGQTCRFDWAAPGLATLSTDERNIDENVTYGDEAWLGWAERRRRGEMIWGHTRDLTGYLREDFEYQEIKSFVSMPIWVNGQWWGHIGIDDCVAEREWTESEKSVLRTVAYLLGDAIELSASSLVMSEASRVAMLQAAIDGIVIIDEAGHIVEFNPAAERLFGRAREDVLGRNLGETIVPPAHRPGHERGHRAYLAGGAPRMIGRRVETEGMRADGSLVPIELTITEIRVEGRHLFAAYLRDLTDRKASEAQIARQREQLHHSEKLAALGSLLAGVAHELNNPLAIVVAQTALLHDKTTDPNARVRAEKIRMAAERCGRIVKSFLAMVRRQPPARRMTDLNEVVRAACEMTAYGARSAGIEVRFDLDPDLPEILADADQLGQIAANLLINAQQAMLTQAEARVITVSTRRDAVDAVRLTVEDTGPGVPNEIKHRVFEPYFTTKPLGAGTGIGLSVCLDMAKSHGGAIAVEDSTPRGARFVVRLPIGHAVPEGVAAPAVPASRWKRALIVDDEPEVAAVLAEMLQEIGIVATVTTSSDAALPIIQAVPPDLVFCDLRMPGLGGVALHARITESVPQLRDRFVLVTGDTVGVNSALTEFHPSARISVLEKPFTRPDVEAVLREIA